MEGKTHSRVAMGLMCGLAICCAVMYVTADGAETILSDEETAASDVSVSDMEGPTSVASTDVQKAGTVITNTPDGRMRLTDYLTNVEKEIAAEEAARKRDVETVRAQMARNMAFNAAARKKLNAALNAKMAANAKAAKDHLAHAMRFVQGKFAAAAALQNKRHALEDEQHEKQMKDIAADKALATKNLENAVLSQQRAMAALESQTNAHIKQTDERVSLNGAQILANAKKAKDDLDNMVGDFDKKVAAARQGAADTRSKLMEQLQSQDAAAREYANNKIKVALAKTAAEFNRVREKMAEDRAHADGALKTATTRMDAAFNAHAALQDKRFAATVKDIAAAKSEAEQRVAAAKTSFKTSLRSLTATIDDQVSKTNNRITQLSGVVDAHKVAQAKVNANVAAETKRMIKLGADRYAEHLKKDEELKNLVDSNKAATDARMEQMSAHYVMELDAVRATMKKNRAHATKMLGKASSELYTAIAKGEAAQTKTNGDLRDQTREATLEINRSLNEAKTDFTTRLGDLHKKVTDNQKKFEGKLDDLTGIVRANAVKDAKGRDELNTIMKANKAELDSAVRSAVEKGEKRMNGVENDLMDLNAKSKAALNNKITAEISQLTKDANSQIENLRLNSKEAREEMKKELLFAVRSMGEQAKKDLDAAVAEKTTAFVAMNEKEDAAAKLSAEGRAALAESIAEEKKIAEQQLSDGVATLHRSMLALKTETEEKIKKTNNRVDAYAKALEKEAEDVDAMMKEQVTTLTSNIDAQKKAASDAITAADAASTSGFEKAQKAVEDALKEAEKKSSDKFGEVYKTMAKNRAELDTQLASSVTGMNDAIAKQASLADSRFKKTVKDIEAARKQASDQVVQARKEFATGLATVTSSIKEMDTRLTGDVQVVSGMVLENRAAQVKVNRHVEGELKRIETLMNSQQSESVKARGALRAVLDENKRAAAEELKELDTLFKSKIASVRSQMAANDKDARKDLSDATEKLYSDMAAVQKANIDANGKHAEAIAEYNANAQAGIAASKKDFTDRLSTLTTTVAANHKKVEEGLEVLTGVVRKNVEQSAEDRKLIRQQNEAMGADMQNKITKAIQVGEARAKQIENTARSNLAGVKKDMLVEITNTVEEYADKAFKTIQGNYGTIADNYLSLKAYAVTARDQLTEYTAKGKGKNLSSLGDLLNSIAALSAVKPVPSEGLSASDTIPAIFSSDKVKVDNKVTKINGMVNEFINTANACRQRWPLGLGKYLVNKLEASMSAKGVLQVDKIGDKAGNYVFVNGHTVGLSNKLADFEELAVKMGSYESTLAKITAELSGKLPKKVAAAVHAEPPEWQGD